MKNERHESGVTLKWVNPNPLPVHGGLKIEFSKRKTVIIVETRKFSTFFFKVMASARTTERKHFEKKNKKKKEHVKQKKRKWKSEKHQKNRKFLRFPMFWAARKIHDDFQGLLFLMSKYLRFPFFRHVSFSTRKPTTHFGVSPFF